MWVSRAGTSGTSTPHLSELFTKLPRAELIAVAACLALMAGGFQEFFRTNDADRSAGNFSFQIASAAIYGSSLILLLYRYGAEVFTTAVKCWSLFLLIGLCLASPIWSVEPLTSFRRATALALSMVFSLYIAIRLSPRDLYKMMGYVFFLIAIAAVLAAILVPNIGMHDQGHHFGNWRGLTGHKNSLGRFMGMGVIWAWCGLVAGPRNMRLRSLLSLLLFGLVLILSTSKTPLLSAVCAILGTTIISFIIFPKFGKNDVRYGLSLRLLVGAVIAVGSVFLVWTVLPFVLELAGRDATFTGRDKIWSYGIEIGERRPVFGAGYGAFWIDRLTADFLRWNPYFHDPDAANANEIMTNGHNGYLDTWLQLGWVGYCVLFAWLISYAVRLFGAAASLQSEEGGREVVLWHALLLCFFGFYSFTESIILKQSELLWMAICMSYISMAVRNGMSALPFGRRDLQAARSGIT